MATDYLAQFREKLAAKKLLAGHRDLARSRAQLPVECSDLSPLSAGDSSPSNNRKAFGYQCVPPLARARHPIAKRITADSDGDQSPAESGENSPHSHVPRDADGQ